MTRMTRPDCAVICNLINTHNNFTEKETADDRFSCRQDMPQVSPRVIIYSMEGKSWPNALHALSPFVTGRTNYYTRSILLFSPLFSALVSHYSRYTTYPVWLYFLTQYIRTKLLHPSAKKQGKKFILPTLRNVCSTCLNSKLGYNLIDPIYRNVTPPVPPACASKGIIPFRPLVLNAILITMPHATLLPPYLRLSPCANTQGQNL